MFFLYKFKIVRVQISSNIKTPLYTTLNISIRREGVFSSPSRMLNPLKRLKFLNPPFETCPQPTSQPQVSEPDQKGI